MQQLMVISIFPQAQHNYFLRLHFLGFNHGIILFSGGRQVELSGRAESGHSLSPDVPDLSSLGCQPGQVQQQHIIAVFAFFMCLCKAFDS